ncbi:MAG: hypothetical protein U0746_23075 [Gemmataceae bacterium]
MRTVTRREALATGAGVLTAAGFAVRGVAQPPGVGPAAMSNGLDTMFAVCLLAKGRKQIDVCRFAQPKLHDDGVKQFAQAEIDEHETIRRKLDQLGYAYPANIPSAPAGGITQAGGTQLMAGRMPVPPGMAAWLPVENALIEQCIATEKAELGKKEGVKFEKAFVGCQLAAHYGLFDTAVTFRKFCSPQMAAILDEGRGVIERHIQTCKGLMESLEAKKDHAGS